MAVRLRGWESPARKKTRPVPRRAQACQSGPAWLGGAVWSRFGIGTVSPTPRRQTVHPPAGCPPAAWPANSGPCLGTARPPVNLVNNAGLHNHGSSHAATEQSGRRILPCHAGASQRRRVAQPTTLNCLDTLRPPGLIVNHNLLLFIIVTDTAQKPPPKLRFGVFSTRAGVQPAWQPT